MELKATDIHTGALHQRLDSQAAALQRQIERLRKAPEGQGQRLREQAQEMASLFVFQMLQAMRRTIPQSELLQQGLAHDLYYSLFDQEVARYIARREDFGLTSLLMQQLRGLETSAVRPRTTPGGADVYRRHVPEASIPFTLPIQGPISSPYGPREDPIDRTTRFHHGLDIEAPSGTLVYASAPGQVVFSGVRQGYGNLVVVAHKGGYQTYYAHNEANLVRQGDEIRRAQPLARVGQTGRATGPHLHFEVRKDGKPLDPHTFIQDVTSQSSHL
jgi:murein DD-endopeptidase MepM/ murein hydrolase activator NlpD